MISGPVPSRVTTFLFTRMKFKIGSESSVFYFEIIKSEQVLGLLYDHLVTRFIAYFLSSSHAL